MILLARDVERTGNWHHGADCDLARLGGEARRVDRDAGAGDHAGKRRAARDQSLFAHIPCLPCLYSNPSVRGLDRWIPVLSFLGRDVATLDVETHPRRISLTGHAVAAAAGRAYLHP